MIEKLLARWRWRGRHRAVGGDQWNRLRRHSPLVDRYASTHDATYRALTGSFLARKRFEGARGLELDDDLRLLIAAQACIPILGLSLDWFDDWRSIIVYPEDFVVHRATVDEAGVVNESDDPLSGEAWGRGPVILSLARVHEDASAEHWGNLVIHEIAHKLDMQNGVANGMPPLHGDMDRGRWTRVWSTAYDALYEVLDRGYEPWTGEYALEDPAEFFSTMSEAFFTCPRNLRRHHADLYAELGRFYRQDPGALPETA